MSAAISHLQFPFSLKRDQLEAVDSWINNNFRGTVPYSSGTGKTEIAFECARRAALALAARSSIKFQQPNFRDSLTAFNTSLYQRGVFEQMMPDKECFRIRSSTTEDTFYYIDAKNRTCTCPDFKFRFTKCKHILAIEFSSLSTISSSSIAAAQVHEHN
jgi:predicted nucleic acid-binding Zn finger protein